MCGILQHIYEFKFCYSPSDCLFCHALIALNRYFETLYITFVHFSFSNDKTHLYFKVFMP